MRIEHTARSQRLISSDVQSSGSVVVRRRLVLVVMMDNLLPVGSDSAGNTSVPQIDQAATAVTIPAKPAFGNQLY